MKALLSGEDRRSHESGGLSASRPVYDIRDIDPQCEPELDLVAQRMLDTLIEVEGGERGLGIHSLAWLGQRLRWHLDPAQSCARVLVAIDAQGMVVGHTIFRLESRDNDPIGLIATTYVLPAARQAGLAQAFVQRAHAWFLDQGVGMSSTWTSGTNTPLIALYRKLGYEIVDHGPNGINGTPMVKLGAYL